MTTQKPTLLISSFGYPKAVRTGRGDNSLTPIRTPKEQRGLKNYYTAALKLAYDLGVRTIILTGGYTTSTVDTEGRENHSALTRERGQYYGPLIRNQESDEPSIYILTTEGEQEPREVQVLSSTLYPELARTLISAFACALIEHIKVNPEVTCYRTGNVIKNEVKAGTAIGEIIWVVDLPRVLPAKVFCAAIWFATGRKFQIKVEGVKREDVNPQSDGFKQAVSILGKTPDILYWAKEVAATYNKRVGAI